MTGLCFPDMQHFEIICEVVYCSLKDANGLGEVMQICIRCSFLDAGVVSPLLQMSDAIVVYDERMSDMPSLHSRQCNTIVPIHSLQSAVSSIYNYAQSQSALIPLFGMGLGYNDKNNTNL
jgi:hypothetical protein